MPEEELFKTVLEMKGPKIEKPAPDEDALRAGLKLTGLTVLDVRNLLLAVIVLIVAVLGLERARTAYPFAFWSAMGIVALCAANVIWHTVTLVRRRRREEVLRKWAIKPLRDFEADYFRVGPYSGSDADCKRYKRPDGADSEILVWVRSARDPILYLSGVSGAGKSSLLNASLIPALKKGDPPAHFAPCLVIALPEHGDAVAALREALLAPGDIWHDPAEDKWAAPIAELLAEACRQLQEGNRGLVLLCDQFEVTLIRHQTVNPETTALAELLRHVAAGRRKNYPGLCVLLSFRSDYEDLFKTLELPRWVEGKNGRRVAPFSRPVARAFLTDSRCGLELADGRLNEVLDEAEAVTGTPGLIRPIVLNMLGKQLERHAGHEPEKLPRGALLSHDLRRAVESEEVRAHARLVLRSLLRDGVRVARSVAETAQATGLACEVVKGCNKKLLDWPLVRCVEESEDADHSRWEIAHDFVARLLAPILETPLRSFAERLRPFATPALLLLTLSTAVAIWIGRENAITAELSHKYGIQTDVQGDRIVATVVQLEKVDTAALPRIAELLRALRRPVGLNLSKCDKLENVDGLQGLNTLESLELDHCENLKNINGLKGLTAVQNLHLDTCLRLEDVDALKGLTALKGLSLSYCTKLENVDVLRGLTELNSLDLSFCSNLKSVDFLDHLTKLRSLDLGYCAKLKDVDVLKGLTQLQSLGLGNCSKLENVDLLKGLTALQGLDLGYCDKLQNVDGLKGLHALQRLDLNTCLKLGNVDGLKGLVQLQSLDLGACPKLTNVDGLEGLTSLKSLGLENCPELEEVDGLKGLEALEGLVLRDCDKLGNVNGLKGLSHLKIVTLRNCKKLEQVDGLNGLVALEDLDLGFCAKLTKADVIKDLPALHELNLFGTQIRDAGLIVGLKAKGVMVTLDDSSDALSKSSSDASGK